MTTLAIGDRVRRNPHTYDGLIGKPPDPWLAEVGTILRIWETKIFGPTTKLALVSWPHGPTEIALDRLEPAP